MLDVVRPDGSRLVQIASDTHGGFVTVYDRDSERPASMGVHEGGGYVIVNDGIDGKSSASIDAVEDGGRIIVRGKNGKRKELTTAGLK